MNKNSGSCLCGKVQFSVHQNIQIIYHCHCSLCRKQSGTGSNAATLVNETLFEWIAGIDLIKTFKKDTGFTSCFCVHCGSPVPNKVGQSPFIWIPLGLLQEDLMIQQRLGFCLHSKRCWSPAISIDKQYQELPSWHELQDYFDKSY